VNKRILFCGATLLAVTTVIFFICQTVSIFIDVPALAWLSFFVCIFLSWGYIICTIGNGLLCPRNRIVAAKAASFFAVIYSVFICITYFTQLSVVRYKVLSEDIVNAFDMGYPGSWLFVIDIVGYGIMALSTLFMGLSIEVGNKIDKILKVFSLIHGCFVIVIFMPLTSLFLGAPGHSTINTGALGLAVWCIIFFPIPLFSMIRYKRAAIL
jgi:hypothetical protein